LALAVAAAVTVPALPKQTRRALATVVDPSIAPLQHDLENTRRDWRKRCDLLDQLKARYETLGGIAYKQDQQIAQLEDENKRLQNRRPKVVVVDRPVAVPAQPMPDITSASRQRNEDYQRELDRQALERASENQPGTLANPLQVDVHHHR
jgi:hypothetical protein